MITRAQQQYGQEPRLEMQHVSFLNIHRFILPIVLPSKFAHLFTIVSSSLPFLLFTFHQYLHKQCAIAVSNALQLHISLRLTFNRLHCDTETADRGTSSFRSRPYWLPGVRSNARGGGATPVRNTTPSTPTRSNSTAGRGASTPSRGEDDIAGNESPASTRRGRSDRHGSAAGDHTPGRVHRRDSPSPDSHPSSPRHASPTPAAAATPTPEPAPARPRRVRQRNWETAEIVALIHAKAQEHREARNVVDPRARMETATVKWTGFQMRLW